MARHARRQLEMNFIGTDAQLGSQPFYEFISIAAGNQQVNGVVTSRARHGSASVRFLVSVQRILQHIGYDRVILNCV